ncbi:hypothetical protein GVX82_02840 [Patescibacteria group bacterium]|nr:hypothetical protein [Patescibacteria group bacterium]
MLEVDHLPVALALVYLLEKLVIQKLGRTDIQPEELLQLVGEDVYEFEPKRVGFEKSFAGTLRSRSHGHEIFVAVWAEDGSVEIKVRCPGRKPLYILRAGSYLTVKSGTFPLERLLDERQHRKTVMAFTEHVVRHARRAHNAYAYQRRE